MTAALSVLMCVATIVLLTGLAVTDPRRAARFVPASRPGAVSPWTPRRISIAALACVPGLLLASAGWWSAFLVWLGAATISAWIAVRMLAAPPEARRD